MSASVFPPTASDVTEDGGIDLSSIVYALYGVETGEFVSCVNLKNWLVLADASGFALSRLACLEYNGAASLEDLWHISRAPIEHLERWYSDLLKPTFHVGDEKVEGFTLLTLAPLRVAMTALRAQTVEQHTATA
jgi:hypothetical protein